MGNILDGAIRSSCRNIGNRIYFLVEDELASFLGCRSKFFVIEEELSLEEGCLTIEPGSVRQGSGMGDESVDICHKYSRYVNPMLARIMKFLVGVHVEASAKDSVVFTIDGKGFIDCLGGYGVFSCGHVNSKVCAAVEDQLYKMPLSSRVFFSEPLANLSERLAHITPGSLQYSFICNSGAEAVEGALKLARLYSGKTEIISAENAFHGKTFGALSVGGREKYKKPFRPLVPRMRTVPFGDLEALEPEISGETAAVILEPIQGEGGINIPPEGYLRAVRELCTRKNVLLILDEVQTGFGRTGSMFACEREKVVPDILVLGKALGGGVMPIGAFVSTPKIWKSFASRPFIHTSTFGGNPLACCAALAAIGVIESENLPQRSLSLGEWFLEQLKKIQQEFPRVIYDVRGRGLMIGVELCKEGYGAVIFPEMFKRGVITAFTMNNPKVIRFEPSLTITQDELNLVLAVFREAVKGAQGIVGRLSPFGLKLSHLVGVLRY